MRIFKGSWFKHFAKKEKISDKALKNVSNLLERGQFDADLGGGVFKQRLARPGGGKSSGYRLIIFFRKGDRTFFIYAYPKSSLDNITGEELKDYKKLAKHFLHLTDEQLDIMIGDEMFQEIKE
jgi:hypothetical protein